MNAIASPKRFGMVSYHPAIPTAGATDPAREERGEGGGTGTGGQELGNQMENRLKQIKNSTHKIDLKLATKPDTPHNITGTFY